nr:immunoglobulin heavy chain junction region [Mus musculus]
CARGGVDWYFEVW